MAISHDLKRSDVVMKWPVVWLLGWMYLSLSPFVSLLTAQTTLVPLGSTWRYLDTGEDPGAGWRNPAFDDGGWASGPAQLGFSSNPAENDEATLISRTNSLGEPSITFYFRHTFDVPDADLYTNLLVRLRRDDGAIIYLNGVEVFRSNMPLGPVNASTLAFLSQDDGTALFAGPASITTLFSGLNVLAVEVHQNALSSTDVSFDLELLGNVMFEPPSVEITSPVPGAVIGSSTVALSAKATDADGVVTQVEFMEGTEVIGSVTGAPFTFLSFNTPPGNHTYVAVAVDSTGLSSTSAPVVITVVPALVASRSEWKYLDDGSMPDAAWVTATFDDSGWSNGVAQIGFGDGDETTVIRQAGESTGANIVTYFFRKKFVVADPAAVTSLSLRLLRDDGGIVYLNGTEVFRSNLPEGPISSSTFATLVMEDSELRATRVNPALLTAGENVIAVEVHQANAISTDISFDLELLPDLAPRAPKIVVTAPTSAQSYVGPADVTTEVTVTDVDDAIASVNFYLDDRLNGSVTTEPYTWEFEDLVGIHTITVTAVDSLGNTTTSAPVNLAIPGTVSLISTGAVWRYLDSGVDQGTAWRAVEFDDSAWPAGPGRFGTNDSGISTIVKIRTPAGLPLFTTYYRRLFEATNTGTITNLAFRVLRDDGCLAYLNGVEIFRMNMPTGTVTFNTLSPVGVAGTDESAYFPTNISVAQLREGPNVLAVELHQSSGTSDAGFDLGLRGVTVPPVNCPPITVEHLGNTIRLSWTGGSFILQDSDRPEGPFTTLPGATSPHLITPPVGNRFFRLARP